MEALPLPPSREGLEQTISGNFSGQSSVVFDSSRIGPFFEKFPQFWAFEPEVRGFYRKRNFSYAWYEEGMLIEQAGNLAARLMNLEVEGIEAKVPYLHALDSLLHGANGKGNAETPVLELLLTSAYFAYAKLAWEGMPPSVSKAGKWYLPRKKVDYNQYLDSLLSTPKGESSAKDPVYRQ